MGYLIGGDGVIDGSSPEDEMLTSLDVIIAKLLAGGPLMEKVYPALCGEADECIKSVNKAETTIFPPKMQSRAGKRVHYSIQDTLSDLFTGNPASRRYAGISLVVLTSLVLASCKPAQATPTVTDTLDPNRASVTEVTTAPTEFVNQVPSQTTPTPAVYLSTPTEDATTRTPAATVMPAVPVSPEVSPTPEGYVVGDLPETLDGCNRNKLNIKNIDADLSKLLEREQSIELSFTPGIPAINQWQELGTWGNATTQDAPIFLNTKLEAGQIPMINCSLLDIENSHDMYIFTVPFSTRAGHIVYGHFTVDTLTNYIIAQEFDKYSAEPLFLKVYSPEPNYQSLVTGDPATSVFIDILGGEALPDDEYLVSIDASQESTRIILQRAIDQGYLDIIKRIRSGTETQEDVEILNNTLIPARIVMRNPY